VHHNIAFFQIFVDEFVCSLKKALDVLGGTVSDEYSEVSDGAIEAEFLFSKNRDDCFKVVAC
jgi:hypothetical protein